MRSCAGTASPSRLQILRISSPISLADTLQIPEESSISEPSTNKHSALPIPPRRTISKQSFASDTGLLDQDRGDLGLLQPQSPETVQPALRAINRTSTVPSENDEVTPRTANLQHRATLHRQDTDDFVTPVLGYDQWKNVDKSWDSGVDGSEDAMEKLDFDRRKSTMGEDGISVRASHAQMAALGRTRGWRRVSSRVFFLKHCLIGTLVPVDPKSEVGFSELGHHGDGRKHCHRGKLLLHRVSAPAHTICLVIGKLAVSI
jgi:hypothetical protein